jgi:hypothetical protein
MLFLDKKIKENIGLNVQETLNRYDPDLLHRAVWPEQSLDLFIRCAHQNSGRISKSQREVHFGWMTDAEVATAESIIAESFTNSK